MNAFDERRKKILFAIIQSYIDLNMPIGSFFIAQNFPVGLSAASIRNTMVKLEEMGYITQPHTSAGRVPTEKGYRFYVDTLLGEKKLSLRIELSKELSDRFTAIKKDCNKLVKEAAKTLSLYSHCLAIAVPPRTEEMVLKRIKFIMYEKNKVLAVLISENGITYNKVIELDRLYTQKQLDTASNNLNIKFHGMAIKIIMEIITQQIYNDGILCDQLIAELLMLCKDMFISDMDSLASNSFFGASNLPDFATLKQIKKILEAIEDKHFMLQLLNQISEAHGTRVFVGMENLTPALNELSMVISTYKNSREASGAIGIIGPTRMNYKKLIPLVEYTAGALTNILSVK